ncbi:hypothetical protein ACFSCV_00580 [Methylopila henanensis]|uniref:Uncharacterized protein n=1 Tax=Methylopila henanensis TaxID=873516 RepID=A0ABW4K1Y9_9HYPH
MVAMTIALFASGAPASAGSSDIDRVFGAMAPLIRETFRTRDAPSRYEHGYARQRSDRGRASQRGAQSRKSAPVKSRSASTRRAAPVRSARQPAPQYYTRGQFDGGYYKCGMVCPANVSADY